MSFPGDRATCPCVVEGNCEKCINIKEIESYDKVYPMDLRLCFKVIASLSVCLERKVTTQGRIALPPVIKLS